MAEAPDNCGPRSRVVHQGSIDRTLTGYEGLMSAQQCLPNNDVRDRFAADVSYLARLWEAISPDPMLGGYEADYRWTVQVYESVKPVSTTGTAALAPARREDDRAHP